MNTRRAILACAGTLTAAGALALAPGGASAGTHHPGIQKTAACGLLSPACIDVFNQQLGRGYVLNAQGAPPAAGSAITLRAHNGQSSRQDFTFIPRGYVTSVLNGDPINYPFTDDPVLDEQLIQAGDTFVFSYRWTPFGQNSSLYAGLNANDRLTLEPFGPAGSQRRAENLWITAPDYQLNTSAAVINVGESAAEGDLEVLTINDGAGPGTRPFVTEEQQDALGQFPETQEWNLEPNYP